MRNDKAQALEAAIEWLARSFAKEPNGRRLELYCEYMVKERALLVSAEMLSGLVRARIEGKK